MSVAVIKCEGVEMRYVLNRTVKAFIAELKEDEACDGPMVYTDMSGVEYIRCWDSHWQLQPRGINILHIEYLRHFKILDTGEEVKINSDSQKSNAN